MIAWRSYQSAFAVALALHLLIMALLFSDQKSARPVLTPSELSQAQEQNQPATQPIQEAIQAVNIDNNEITEAVNRLKSQRAEQKLAEETRQRRLQQQADAARQQRIAEQKHLEELKHQASVQALAQQKKLLAEQAHLKELAQQKISQEKRLAELKQQQIVIQKQQEQAKQLALVEKKKAEQLAQANAAKQKAELLKKQLAANQLAAENAAKKAQLAGQVDKYKALIINAISQQWIIPESADRRLSSQFRIRLSPNGNVLEVSLIRSSGDSVLDRSAQSAIYKASPLPVPVDADAFNVFRDISLTVRPEGARG